MMSVSSSPSHFILPPAPNWFSNHALSSSPLGDGSVLVAYAAKQDVVLMRDSRGIVRKSKEEDEVLDDPRTYAESKPDNIGMCFNPAYPSVTVLKVFSERFKVIAVDLLHDDEIQQLAATSEDGLVRSWVLIGGNIENALNFKEHDVHKSISLERPRVLSVCWSLTEKGLVISGDEQGNIAVWDTRINATRSMSFGKNGILCMKSNPFLRDVIVFGCKLGLVFIVNVSGAGKVLHKIRAHDEDIQSLSWAPVPHDVFDDVKVINEAGDDTLKNKEGECDMEINSLFAVASRDRTISIWSSKTGRQMASLRLVKMKVDRQNQSFNSCLWVEPTILLTNGSYAQLLEWDLKGLQNTNEGLLRGDEKIESVQVLHEQHAKIVSSITSQGSQVFTIGQDRSFVAYDRHHRVLDYNMPAFASWVYCIAANCVEPSLIAIGGGDSQIRIWKTNSNKSLFDVSAIWQKLNAAKVTALSWHPLRENILAFATDEGRIGLVDALSPRSVPNFISYKHRSMIYNLSWGPEVVESDDTKEAEKGKLMLFSCGDGQVVMHDAFDMGVKSKNVEEIITKTNALKRSPPSRSDLSFHPDGGKFVAVGSDDGSVEIFSLPHLKLLATLKTFQKLIQNLAWHPSHCGTNDELSKFESWLAVASNENDVHLFDLKIMLVTSQNPDQKTLVTSPNLVLPGHLFRVIQLCWSPHQEEKLVSVSYDGTAQVWDASTGTPVANYQGHQGRVVCCMFSPLDPDIVFTGAEDCTLHAWRISAQVNTIPTKKVAKKPSKKSFAKNVTPVAELQILLEEKKQELLNSNNDDKLLGAKEKKKLREKLLFPKTFHQENARKQECFEDCLLVEKLDFTSIDFEEYIHLGLFHDRASTEQVLLSEATSLTANGQNEPACHLRLWHGEICDTIRAAMESGQLTDWMINLAASASRELWVEACQAYAIQLEAKEDPIKAASYFLMIHRITEAIHVLMKANQFRAAVSIAKSRLPPTAPLLKEVFLAWAKLATSDGSYELAAKCWIAAGDPLQASHAISKRRDTSALRVAAILARNGGDHEKARVLAMQCITQCLKTSNLSCLEKMKADFKDLVEQHVDVHNDDAEERGE